MRRWGVIITAFYVAVVVGLLLPGALWLAGGFDHPFRVPYGPGAWPLWLWVGVLVGGEALLLFLSVDTSWRRRKPRQHVAVTAILVALFVALLTGLAIWSVVFAVYGGQTPPGGAIGGGALVAGWMGLWAVWGVVFYLYYRGSPKPVTAAVSWLLKGSVLELLIAVPAHVVVRHRHLCTAPGVTAFGIVTGVAIMLLCFGPGVLALYGKRLAAYARPREKGTPPW
jgi:hypothetical protein